MRSLGWAPTEMTGVLIRRGKALRYQGGKKPCADGGGGWRDESQIQGTLRTAGNTGSKERGTDQILPTALSWFC